MSQVQSNPNWPYGYVPTPTEWANAWAAKADSPAPVLSSTTPLTLAANGWFAWNGVTGTWTLPALSDNVGPIRLKNIGTGVLTVAAHSGDHVFTTSSVTSFTMAIGDSCTLINYGTTWGKQ